MEGLLFQTHLIWIDGGSILFGAIVASLFVMILGIRSFFRYLRHIQKTHTAPISERLKTLQIDSGAFEEDLLALIKEWMDREYAPDKMHSKTGEEILPYIQNKDIKDAVSLLEKIEYNGQSLPQARRKEILDLLRDAIK